MGLSKTNNMSYPERYVAFVDVLGFKDLLKTDYPDMLQEYLNSMEIWIDFVNNPRTGNIKKFSCHTMSDSIVIYNEEYPEATNSEYIANLIYVVTFLQSFLLANKIYTRGAISKGTLVYHEKTKILAGNGLVAAYELEKQVNFPKVIIDDKVIFEVANNRQDFVKIFSQFPVLRQNKTENVPFLMLPTKELQSSTLDNNVFLNYGLLRAMHLYNDEPTLKEIYEDVKKKLYTKPEIKEKFTWFAKYMAYSIREADPTINFDFEPEKSQIMNRNTYREYVQHFDNL